jgi:hypothetical protein
MRVDDVVAELELDELDFAGDLDVVRERCFFGCLWRNGVLLRRDRPGAVLDSSL